MSNRQNKLPEFQSKEYLKDKSSMPTVNIVAEKNTQNKWLFRPDASSIKALSDYFVKTPRASNQKIKINIQSGGRQVGTTEIPPITTTARSGDEAGVLNWIRAGYTAGAVPSFPEPELQIYRQIYYHEMQQGALTEAVKLNTERDYQQGMRKNLTESELSRLILSTGVVDGKDESHFQNEQDITEMLKQDQNLGNPDVFSSDYFTVLKKMKEKGFTLPGQDLVLGSYLQVHLFDKGRYILFNNHGGYTVETEPSVLNGMTPTQKQGQKAGDVAWTGKLKKMFDQNVHQDPIALSRGLLANARNMQLQTEGKKSADKNVNVLRNLGTRLETLIPHNPNNPSRSAEIGHSNLKTWEKTFLSLTYAVKNDVVNEVDKEQQLAIDNAVATGNNLTTREAVANGVGDPLEAAKTYLPMVAIPGLIYLIMKAFGIGDKGGVMGGLRKVLAGITVLGGVGALYGIYKSTAGASLREKALGTPEEPEKTPSTTEKQIDSVIGQWKAKYENGAAWTEILQSTPELTKPRNRGGFAIGDLMVALHPNDARYTGLNSIKTSDAEVIRASKFVQEFTRTHQITETQFQTMVEEIWRSNKIMRGDAFQAQTEKNNTVGDIAKYVDNEEGFFSNTLQALTGGLKERRMFATFVEYRTRMNNVPMGDILHIFNENVPGASRFYHPLTSPVTSFTNMWVDKLDVQNIPKSANFAANKTRVLLPPPQNISDEGRLYLRKLFNTIWTKQQESNSNDAKKLIKDTIHIPESVV